MIREPFLLAVSDTLGDRYSAHMENIYQKTIDFILDTLKCGFLGTPPEGSTKVHQSDNKKTDSKNHLPQSVKDAYESGKVKKSWNNTAS